MLQTRKCQILNTRTKIPVPNKSAPTSFENYGQIYFIVTALPTVQSYSLQNESYGTLNEWGESSLYIATNQVSACGRARTQVGVPAQHVNLNKTNQILNIKTNTWRQGEVTTLWKHL